MGEYRKEKLDVISKQSEIFLCNSKKSRVCENGWVDKCRYGNRSQNTYQLENVEEKSFIRASLLIRIFLLLHKVLTNEI